MMGYGVIDHEGKFYHINLAIHGWSEEKYGVLAGPAYCIPLGCCLLISGAISDHFNRKIIIIISSLGWSSVTFYNAYVKDINVMFMTRFFIACFHAFFIPASYSLVIDLFPYRKRFKAFLIYSVLIELGDTVSALTINLITLTGWSDAFKICGIFGLFASLLTLVVVREPIREVKRK